MIGMLNIADPYVEPALGEFNGLLHLCGDSEHEDTEGEAGPRRAPPSQEGQIGGVISIAARGALPTKPKGAACLAGDAHPALSAGTETGPTGFRTVGTP